MIDVVYALAAVLIGGFLAGFSGPLAHLMLEGDDRYREQYPWVQAYEPQSGFLATTTGRWWILRSYLILSAVGFEVIGLALLVRVV